MQPRHGLREWLLLLLLSALWGTSFLALKIAVATIPPATVAAGRLTVASVILLVIVFILRLRIPGSGVIWWHFLALSILGNILPFLLISWGQQRIDSGLAGILMGVTPLVTLVLAHFFVQNERMTLPKVAGFGLGFCGLIVLMGPHALGTFGGVGLEFLSQIAVLGGALFYALNAVLARRLPATHPLLTSGCVILIGSVLLLPVALWTEQPWQADISVASAIALFWLGLGATALATLVYFRLVSVAGATFVTLANYIIPVCAVVVGMLVLGEQPGINALAALGFILSGIIFAQYRRRPRPEVGAKDPV